MPGGRTMRGGSSLCSDCNRFGVLERNKKEE